MKKYLAIMLALALVVATPISAFASIGKTDDTGDASIGFETDGTPPVIVPEPEDPDPGDKDEWDKMVVSGLDFGIHDLIKIIGSDQSFDSEKWAGRREENGTKEVATASEYTGFIIKNGSSFEGWNVKVKMNQFKNEKGADTMTGFTLTLNKKNELSIGGKAPSNVMNPVPLTAGQTQKLVIADDLEGIGYYGYYYNGVLDIKANTITGAGDAEAVMEWSVVAGPV